MIKNVWKLWKAVNKCPGFENGQKKESIYLWGIVPPGSSGTCGGAGAGGQRGPSGGSEQQSGCAGAPSIRKNASCWQRDATVRVKVKLLAACVPLEPSQSGIKTKEQ